MVMLMEQGKTWLWTAPRWVEILLVLLAAWVVAGAIVGEDMQVKSKVPMGYVNDTQSEQSLVDISLLQKVALFGKADKKVAKPVDTQAKTAPVVASRLNIKLIGTVVAGEKSAAMVAVGGGKKQNVFFLEEEIQPNVVLKEVEATEIVVSNHGKRERISIEAGKAIAHAVPNRTVAKKPTRASLARQINKRLDRVDLQKQMRNFSTLLSQARVTPHFTNGKPDGFTISEIVKGSLYEQIGLRNGDVIHKVNNEAVTSAEQAMRMYRELQTATFIDVEISRGGSILQLNYAIQ